MKIPRPRASKRHALSTVEIVVSTAIVGVMLVAALNSLGTSYRNRRLNVDRLTGTGLARELMAEIMAQPYSDPENGESNIGVDLNESAVSRTTFDDVDDYHGYNVANAVGRNGSLLAGYTGWRQQVGVSRARLTDAAAVTGSDTGLKRITVTIISPTGKTTQFTSLRAVGGALEQTLPLETESVVALNAELRLGASLRSERTAIAMPNHVDEVN